MSVLLRRVICLYRLALNFLQKDTFNGQETRPPTPLSAAKLPFSSAIFYWKSFEDVVINEVGGGEVAEKWNQTEED